MHHNDDHHHLIGQNDNSYFESRCDLDNILLADPDLNLQKIFYCLVWTWSWSWLWSWSVLTSCCGQCHGHGFFLVGTRIMPSIQQLLINTRSACVRFGIMIKLICVERVKVRVRVRGCNRLRF